MLCARFLASGGNNSFIVQKNDERNSKQSRLERERKIRFKRRAAATMEDNVLKNQ